MLPMFGVRTTGAQPKENGLQSKIWRCGCVMLYGCFSAFGTGNLVRVKGIMKIEDYEKIL